jgi:hypothetical protein
MPQISQIQGMSEFGVLQFICERGLYRNHPLRWERIKFHCLLLDHFRLTVGFITSS